MIRATTPTHSFTLPFDYNSYVEKILISYFQDDKIVLEKTESDVEIDGKIVSYKLTQQETNLFSDGIVKIQVRVITLNQDALVSNIYHMAVKDVLNDEVL